MNDYRPLTTEEIEVLKHNDCWAEDWTSVNVYDFRSMSERRPGMTLLQGTGYRATAHKQAEDRYRQIVFHNGSHISRH